jgi:prepilin-type N-terminal cleavage/methylation domain-containing protein
MTYSFKNDNGFTIMELMVVVGIIAVLAVVSTPFLRTMYIQQQFSGAVQEVLSSIRQARLTAVEKNESVVVSFNTAAGTFQVFVDDAGGNLADLDLNGVPDIAQDWTRNGNEQTIVNSTVPQSVAITAANFTGNPVFRFDSRGFPMSSVGNMLTNGTITMSSTLGRTRQIDLFRNGHSRAQ